MGLGCAALLLLPQAALAQSPGPNPPKIDPKIEIAELRFIGEATFPTQYLYAGTEVGGLSGIDYDPEGQIFYALSDDRSQINPARFYTLTIDLSDGALDNGDVVFTGVTTLLDTDGTPFTNGEVDPESLRFNPKEQTLYWTSEGDAANQIPPFVREMQLDGTFVRQLTPPTQYTPTAGNTSGIRNNLAFESLTLALRGLVVFTATENALVQDGPAASLTEGSPSRMLAFRTGSGEPFLEFVYETEPVAAPPTPETAFSTNGLVEILSLGRAEFLALERSFSSGVGNAIQIFVANVRGASNVSGVESIQSVNNLRTAEKTLLLDLAALGIPLDNVEGMAFGPTLPNGNRSLILVSDNNFSATQFTQFLAFEVVEAE